MTHLAEELAKIAGVKTGVMEESFEATDRLIPTEMIDAELIDFRVGIF